MELVVGAEAILDLGKQIGGVQKRLDDYFHQSKAIRRKLVGTIGNLPASGTFLVDLGTPANGRMWIIRALASFEHIPGQPGPSTATATGAAGAAVSVSVPFFSPLLTGFDVTAPPAAAAGNTTVTVSGAGLPSLVYNISQTTTAPLNFSVRYPAPGILQGTVTVAAEASGGAVTVNVYGVATGSPVHTSWYIGQVPITNAQPPLADVFWQSQFSPNASFQTFPEFQTFTDDAFWVYPSEHILVWFQDGIPGENLYCFANVEEYPLKAETALAV